MDNNKEYRAPPETETDQSYESFNGPLGDFAVPTMEELGMVGTTSIRGGETRALEVFEEFMKDKKRVATFEKPKTAPGLFDPPSSMSSPLCPSVEYATDKTISSDSTFAASQIRHTLLPNVLPPSPRHQRRSSEPLHSSRIAPRPTTLARILPLEFRVDRGELQPDQREQPFAIHRLGSADAVRIGRSEVGEG